MKELKLDYRILFDKWELGFGVITSTFGFKCENDVEVNSQR
jgi:hypothetical protein